MPDTSNTFTAADHLYMARALKLARQGWFTTHPNPRVGCVLVKQQRIIGEGFHQRAGEPHAERVALANCRETPQGSTAYVTLEPCCHYGRTPPCTEGLIEAGVHRVVVAMTDPNPQVAGKGIDALRAAGIEVSSGLYADQAADLNPGFIKRMSRKLPWVTCKMAASLDARTAMASGESRWITSDSARQDVQRQRAGAAAILTGIGTVLHDDPSMNVRLSSSALGLEEDQPVRQPLRVILDAQLKIPSTAKILTLPGKALIFCQQSALPRATELKNDQVEVEAIASHDGKLDLMAVMSRLAERQINEVLLESGATLAGSMLQVGLVDELLLYQANHLMGDAARGLLHLEGLDNMIQRIELTLLDSRRVGPDTRYRLAPVKQADAS